jgi:hypothetical protein
MVCILVLALAIAALRSASDSWVSAIFSMTLGLLMTAVLGVGYRRGSRRAFWLMSFGPWFETWVAPDLLLTRPIKDLGYAMHPPPVFEGPIQRGTTEDFASRDSFRTQDNFIRIGKSLAVLVVALLGGFVAVGFSLSESRRGHTPGSPAVSTR